MVPFNDVLAANAERAAAFFAALAAPRSGAAPDPAQLAAAAREAAAAAPSMAHLGPLREVHKSLSEHADFIYECAPTPLELQRLQRLLTDLGPADADESAGDASLTADWSPETIVARIAAVKDALLGQLPPLGHGLTPAHAAATASARPLPSRSPAASPDEAAGAAATLASAGRPAAGAARASKLARVRMSMVGGMRGGSGGGGGGGGGGAAVGGSRLDAGVATPRSAALLAEKAAQACGIGLAQSRRARAVGRRGSVDDMALGRDSLAAHSATGSGEAEHDSGSHAAASRAARLEAEDLRRQLRVAHAENAEIRRRMTLAEAALRQTTEEVL